ncbi:NAD(P)-dependent dehydrogenase (short-subunit alcohol dehydrogenase family) [Pseudochelatococcus lubricantis]|uniref:NAD(P)-dependent dehydrogenase (Short-subunit alcohol dehydrogenase family) n=1 Tax=Pseudochelatococcus lubricantis TaxID=1538102 RepID=A0ABX0V379_9HYPH|nr:SDR family NAD(P)-dependent oxidoreductase [Pseudochelatococcus lubricantis]NIJ59038.1 NAD(P)-dependent dehydrogenase (short-subunit alcohol dehydrogenase family) [Pseudochelatococcus lubricantis]
MQPQVPITPSFRLDGRHAIVTGGGRGIGFALAAALAQAGARVTLWARSPDEIEDAAATIRAHGGAAQGRAVDVRDGNAVREAMDAAEPCDILVNNAGTNRPRPFVDATEEEFDTVMGLNVRAAYFVAQAAARRMISAGRAGAIVNVSSQAGHVAAAGRSAYTISKFAVEGMTKSLAVELAPRGIRVNSLCPTFIETEMTRPALSDPAFRDFVLSRIRLGRLGRVEDLMGAAVFLASDASALMTGSSLMVDGGWTAG